jgi:NAD-dependent SIR2 family protein deacetylase
MLTVQLDAVTCDTTAQEGLRDVINQIQTAKRIVVVCGLFFLVNHDLELMIGAGISTATGIPDFRSASGLFSSGEKGKGHAQDLFHVRSLTVSSILRLSFERSRRQLTDSRRPFYPPIMLF